MSLFRRTPKASPVNSGRTRRDHPTYALMSSGGWIEVVGTDFHEAQICRVLGLSTKQEGRESRKVPLQLVAEPDNPHDPNAVSVRTDGKIIGYLPRAEARTWQPQIARIESSGHVPTVKGSLSANVYKGWGDENGNPWRVYVSAHVISESPALAIPANDPPAGPHSLLPSGTTIKVKLYPTAHAALLAYLPQGGSAAVLIELRRRNDTRKPVIEAVLDGQPIGELTPAMSAKVLALVDHWVESGLTPIAHGKAQVSTLDADLGIQVARSHEVDYEATRTQVTVPSLSSGGPPPPAYGIDTEYINLPAVVVPEPISNERVTAMIPGQNMALPGPLVRATTSPGSDVFAFLLDASGTCQSDDDVVFFNNPGTQGVLLDDETVVIDTTGLPTWCKKVVVAVANPDGGSVSGVSDVRLDDDSVIRLEPSQLGNLSTVMLAEVYRRGDDEWRLRCVAQGWSAGLAPLFGHFGIEAS